jgi:hypothetical protein
MGRAVEYGAGPYDNDMGPGVFVYFKGAVAYVHTYSYSLSKPPVSQSVPVIRTANLFDSLDWIRPGSSAPGEDSLSNRRLPENPCNARSPKNPQPYDAVPPPLTAQMPAPVSSPTWRRRTLS